jgi:hypothetical protein
MLKSQHFVSALLRCFDPEAAGIRAGADAAFPEFSLACSASDPLNHINTALNKDPQFTTIPSYNSIKQATYPSQTQSPAFSSP